jgi:mannosyl-oligosaccharide glucosidase
MPKRMYLQMFHLMIKVRMNLPTISLPTDTLALGNMYHVIHKGYISIMPLLLGLLKPSSSQLGALLDLVSDPKHLWTPFGVCSLSQSSPHHGSVENYWRGPIWVNINYLLLESLQKVSAV